MSVQATISEKCGAEEPALGENLEQFGEALRFEEGDYLWIQQAAAPTGALPDVFFEFDGDGFGEVAGNGTTRVVRTVDISNETI